MIPVVCDGQVLREVPEFICGWCGETCERVNVSSESVTLDHGEEIVCAGCGAVHKIVADGLRLTGEFERETR